MLFNSDSYFSSDSALYDHESDVSASELAVHIEKPSAYDESPSGQELTSGKTKQVVKSKKIKKYLPVSDIGEEKVIAKVQKQNNKLNKELGRMQSFGSGIHDFHSENEVDTPGNSDWLEKQS